MQHLTPLVPVSLARARTSPHACGPSHPAPRRQASATVASMTSTRARAFAAIASLTLFGCDPAPMEPLDGGMEDGSVTTGCTGMADGTSCGADRICVDEDCVEEGCGDGFVGAGEECDDGNATAFDGCEPTTCQFTCSDAAACDDGQPCNGAETCSAAHVCAMGTSLAPGTDCTTTEVPDGVCRGSGAAAECAVAGCGNGVVDGTEDCDDMNETLGDGCDNDCTYSCTDAADCTDDPDMCDGPDTCDTTAHVCVGTTPLDCDDGVACTDDACDAVSGCSHTDNGTGPFWYADCDGDDYAAGDLGSMQSCAEPAASPAVCGTYSARWTSRRPITGAIDCYDASFSVHPGADFAVLPVAGVPAGADFDYNCDGVEEGYGPDVVPCEAGTFHYDTLVANGWTSANCGTDWSAFKWVCEAPGVPGHWSRFRVGEDGRVPCR